MKALVIGWGKMGQLRSAALSQLGVEWEAVDPVQWAQYMRVQDVPLEKFTHAIIATPPDQHALVYDQLIYEGFNGPILIEKPVATTEYDIRRLFGDSRVTPGMTERCQPAAISLTASPPPTQGIKVVWDGQLLDGIIHPIDLITCAMRLTDPVAGVTNLSLWGSRIDFLLRGVPVQIDMLSSAKQRLIRAHGNSYVFLSQPYIVYEHTAAWLQQQEWLSAYTLEGHLLWNHLSTVMAGW